MNSTITEELMYSTVRLICKDSLGQTSYGTGFVFAFFENMEDNRHVPFIITNKHVVKGAFSIEFTFNKTDENDQPLDTEHINFTIDDIQKEIIGHPDPFVDLCAISMNQIIKKSMESGDKFYLSSIPQFVIPKGEDIDKFNAIEDVIMIGYPISLWDKYNNKPISRKGITASHPKLNYQGKRDILIDAACYPGSSGSPVFIINEGTFSNKEFVMAAGRRIFLLGVLYSGPTHTLDGKNSPANVVHLGHILKSERLFELEAHVKYKFFPPKYY